MFAIAFSPIFFSVTYTLNFLHHVAKPYMNQETFVSKLSLTVAEGKIIFRTLHYELKLEIMMITVKYVFMVINNSI